MSQPSLPASPASPPPPGTTANASTATSATNNTTAAAAAAAAVPPPLPHRRASTSRFLSHHDAHPSRVGYHTGPALAQRINTILWSQLLTVLPPHHLLPHLPAAAATLSASSSSSSSRPASSPLLPSSAAPPHAASTSTARENDTAAAAAAAAAALAYLAQCGWSLVEAQRRAQVDARQAKGKSPENRSYGGRAGAHSHGAQQQPSQSAELGPEYAEDRRGMPCGHVFRKGEAIYRCRDCALDDTCVQCAPCFNASNHEGHDIVFSVSTSSGGCCDCGDGEAWKNRLGCTYHEVAPSDELVAEPEIQSSGPPPPSALGAGAPRGSDDVDMADDEAEVEGLTSTSPGGAATTPSSSNRGTSGEPDVRSLDALLSRMPAKIVEDSTRLLAELLDFVLDTLEHAPEDMRLPSGPEAVEAIKRLPCLDELDEGGDSASLEADEASSQHAPSPSSGSRHYAVVLWNDEKHSFKEVIDIVKEATRATELEAKQVAERVDRHGREIINVSTEVRKLLLVARKLHSIDLAVTLRPAFDVFAEEVAGHVLCFLLELASASLFVPTSAHQEGADGGGGGGGGADATTGGPLAPNAAAMRALVARGLLTRWSHVEPISTGRMARDFFDPTYVTKFDALLLMDHKLWKGARAKCKKLYMALIGPRQVKGLLAARFARMYPKIYENFIVRDREPEHNITSLTVQLFSVPSIAEELFAEAGLLAKLLAMLQAIFTSNLIGRSLVLPPPRPSSGQASPQSMMLRQQSCYHIFYDVRYLLNAEGVQRRLVRDESHLETLVRFLALFNSLTPDKRQVRTHVEFESDLWIPVFQVSTQLARVAKCFGEAYARATPLQLVRALGLATRNILQSCLSLQARNPDVHAPVQLRPVRFGGQSYIAINFAVESQPVSFHHPMHWLLAETFRHLHRLDARALEELGKSVGGRRGLPDLLDEETDENGLMVLVEYPLRVVVKLAQVRAGLWVRNGYAIRSQAHHYRDRAMRDMMYDQDLYLLQVGLAMVDPDRFLVTVLDRFRLLTWLDDAEPSWMSGSAGETDDGAPHDVYDAEQLVFMAEEMLLLLLTLVSETSAVRHWRIEDEVRREIVQYLALQQGTYSELTAHISDRLTDHASFDRVLAQCAKFRAPDGTTDLGMFELRDECFDEVAPFFFKYTRNQREQAVQVLRERARKKRRLQRSQQRSGANENGDKDDDDDDFVVVPSPQLQGELPFVQRLRAALTSPVLLQTIFYTLARAAEAVASEGEPPDTLVDASLQLLMVGLVELPGSFARALASASFRTERLPESLRGGEASTSATPLGLLCVLEKSDAFKHFRAKLGWIVDRALRDDDEVASAVAARYSRGVGGRRGEASSGPGAAASAEAARRAAAKARQAAIMQQFSARQQSLLQSFEDEMDEDEDGDEADGGAGRGGELGDGDAGTSGGAAAAAAAGARSEVKREPCILCQEPLDSRRAFGRLAHVQGSRLVRTTPRNDAASLQESVDVPLTLDRNSASGRRVTMRATDARQRTPLASFPAEDHRYGFYASSCGHMMHHACFQLYCRGVEQRHSQQIARNHPENLSRREFICPLCKSLGNVLLPVATDAKVGARASPAPEPLPLSDWVRRVNIEILKNSTQSNALELQETEHGTGSFLPWYPEYALRWWLRDAQRRHALPSETYEMLQRLMQVLDRLSDQSQPQREAWMRRTVLAPPSLHMYVPEELVAYTIGVLEVTQRGAAPPPPPTSSGGGASGGGSGGGWEGTVGGSLNDATTELLGSLLQCLRDAAFMDFPREEALPPLRQGLYKRLLPHWGNDEAVRSPLLLRDPLTVLVEAAVLAPESLSQVTTLMYYATLVQAVFGLAQPSIWPQSLGADQFVRSSALRQPELSEAEASELKTIFPEVRYMMLSIIGFVGYARGNITLFIDSLDQRSLAKLLYTYTLPFLRRAALLYRALGVAPAPATTTTTTTSGGGGAPRVVGDDSLEYLRLLRMLRIPMPAEALPVGDIRQTPLGYMVEGWIKHAYISLASLFRPLPLQPSPLGGGGGGGGGSAASSASSSLAGGHGSSASHALGLGVGGSHPASAGVAAAAAAAAPPPHPTLQLEHPHIYELTQLPLDLAALLQEAQRRKCRRCGEVPPEPAVCLLCGEVVCFQTFCCQDEHDQRGECNRHVDACGATSGAFFKLKTNIVLLLYLGNGTFTFSPYLDSHGEVDVGLRKGRPQRLHAQRYDELRRQWLQHAFASVTARRLEAGMDQGGWITI